MAYANPVNFDGSAPTGGKSFGGDFFAAYKHLYGPDNVRVMTYRNAKLLQTIKRKDDFEGDSYMHTLAIETPQVGSVDFAQSQLNGNSATKTTRMTIFRGHEYASLQMNREEIKAARSDKGSLMRKKITETNGCINTVSQSINHGLWNDGSGIRASFTTASGTVSGKTFTLDVASDGIKLAVGLKLQIATTHPTDGTPPTLAASGLTCTVTGFPSKSTGAGGGKTVVNIDTDLGAFGLSGSTKYWVLRAGDGKGFGVNVLDGGMAGIRAWLPAPVDPNGSTPRIAPTDSFWGCNRSVDSIRLGGSSYYAPTGESYSKSLQGAGEELAFNGRGGDAEDGMILYVSPRDFTGVSLELGPNQRYVDIKNGAGEFGFKALTVNNQSGSWALVAEPQVRPGEFFVLDMSGMYLKSLDAVPHLVDDDGLTSLRLANSPGIEIRWAAYPQLVIDCPANHLRGKFAS